MALWDFVMIMMGILFVLMETVMVSIGVGLNRYDRQEPVKHH